MLINHFIDPDLKVEIIFSKEGTAENWGIDFEIRDIGTSAHSYWRLKKIHATLLCFFITFLVTKNSFQKSF